MNTKPCGDNVDEFTMYTHTERGRGKKEWGEEEGKEEKLN